MAGKPVSTVAKATVMFKSIQIHVTHYFTEIDIGTDHGSTLLQVAVTGNFYLLPGGSRSLLWTDEGRQFFEGGDAYPTFSNLFLFLDFIFHRVKYAC